MRIRGDPIGIPRDLIYYLTYLFDPDTAFSMIEKEKKTVNKTFFKSEA